MRKYCRIEGCNRIPFSSEYTAGHGCLCQLHHKQFAEAAKQVPNWKETIDELHKDFTKKQRKNRLARRRKP